MSIGLQEVIALDRLNAYDEVSCDDSVCAHLYNVNDGRPVISALI
jgi:hypothetical protein